MAWNAARVHSAQVICARIVLNHSNFIHPPTSFFLFPSCICLVWYLKLQNRFPQPLPEVVSAAFSTLPPSGRTFPFVFPMRSWILPHMENSPHIHPLSIMLIVWKVSMNRPRKSSHFWRKCQSIQSFPTEHVQDFLFLDHPSKSCTFPDLSIFFLKNGVSISAWRSKGKQNVGKFKINWIPCLLI